MYICTYTYARHLHIVDVHITYSIQHITHIKHTYIHTCIHTYIHTHTHTHAHTHTHTHTHTYIHTYVPQGSASSFFGVFVIFVEFCFVRHLLVKCSNFDLFGILCSAVCVRHFWVNLSGSSWACVGQLFRVWILWNGLGHFWGSFWMLFGILNSSCRTSTHVRACAHTHKPLWNTPCFRVCARGFGRVCSAMLFEVLVLYIYTFMGKSNWTVGFGHGGFVHSFGLPFAMYMHVHIYVYIYIYI